MDGLMTTSEVAKLLRLNERTVAALAKSGLLSGFKLAGQYRFSAAGLDNYLAKCRVAEIDPSQPLGGER